MKRINCFAMALIFAGFSIVSLTSCNKEDAPTQINPNSISSENSNKNLPPDINPEEIYNLEEVTGINAYELAKQHFFIEYVHETHPIIERLDLLLNEEKELAVEILDSNRYLLEIINDRTSVLINQMEQNYKNFEYALKDDGLRIAQARLIEISSYAAGGCTGGKWLCSVYCGRHWYYYHMEMAWRTGDMTTEEYLDWYWSQWPKIIED